MQTSEKLQHFLQFGRRAEPRLHHPPQTHLGKSSQTDHENLQAPSRVLGCQHEPQNLSKRAQSQQATACALFSIVQQGHFRH